MKTSDRDMAKHGADNVRHEQEDVAANDHPRQRETGAEQAQAKAKAKASKQKDKKSGK
jgi:hypothetical protein